MTTASSITCLDAETLYHIFDLCRIEHRADDGEYNRRRKGACLMPLLCTRFRDAYRDIIASRAITMHVPVAYRNELLGFEEGWSTFFHAAVSALPPFHDRWTVCLVSTMDPDPLLDALSLQLARKEEGIRNTMRNAAVVWAQCIESLRQAGCASRIAGIELCACLSGVEPPSLVPADNVALMCAFDSLTRLRWIRVRLDRADDFVPETMMPNHNSWSRLMTLYWGWMLHFLAPLHRSLEEVRVHIGAEDWDDLVLAFLLEVLRLEGQDDEVKRVIPGRHWALRRASPTTTTKVHPHIKKLVFENRFSWNPEDSDASVVQALGFMRTQQIEFAGGASDPLFSPRLLHDLDNAVSLDRSMPMTVVMPRRLLSSASWLRQPTMGWVDTL